jgi:hypothetical protein
MGASSEAGVVLCQSASHRLLRGQAHLAGPKPNDFFVIWFSERLKGNARPLGRRRGASLTRHNHVVTGPPADLSERKERTKMTRRRGSSEQGTRIPRRHYKPTAAPM